MDVLFLRFLLKTKLFGPLKNGPTELSEVVEQVFIPNTRYNEFSKKWIQDGFSPLFEWCSTRNHIVLLYEKDLLVLTAIRNNKTGDYLPYEKMKIAADEYKVFVTPARINKENSVSSFIDQAKKRNWM